MPQYLVAVYHPDDFDPSTITEEMIEEIHALNRELIAAGVRKFTCGISPAGSAKTLRAQPDGKVLVTDRAVQINPATIIATTFKTSIAYSGGSGVGASN